MLSERVFNDTPVRFLAILTWRHGRRYIDLLDRIEEMQRRRHGAGLTRTEVLEACERVLAEGGADDSSDDPAEETSPPPTPPEMLRQLVQAGWLDEPRRNDYQRVYFLDSRAELLLDCLRRMAYPEKVTFTDKLHL